MNKDPGPYQPSRASSERFLEHHLQNRHVEGPGRNERAMIFKNSGSRCRGLGFMVQGFGLRVEARIRGYELNTLNPKP